MLSFYNDFEYATRESAAKRSPLFYIHLYLEVKPVAALPLPYYYGYEAEQFSFYRIPKRLFEDDRFRGVSTDAKLLYGMLLDRMALTSIRLPALPTAENMSQKGKWNMWNSC